MATGQAKRPVLLERAEELAAIDAVIADTLAGLGRFGVVEGSAGIGKSSLLAEARLRATDAGMTVLTARGTEIERSFSYGVVRQLFERLVAQSDQAERSRLLDGAAAHASRLVSAEQLPGQRRARFPLGSATADSAERRGGPRTRKPRRTASKTTGRCTPLTHLATALRSRLSIQRRLGRSRYRQ